MAFSRQAKVEVLFSFDALHKEVSTAVSGRFEPEEALRRLLAGTGFSAQRNARGRFVVAPVAEPVGSIRGRLLGPDGRAAPGVRVVIPAVRLTTVTGDDGAFSFASVPAGSYDMFATKDGYQPLQIEDVGVAAGASVALDTLTMQALSDPNRLEAFVVQGKPAMAGILGDNGGPPAPRTAIGDIDQPRSENDALDYAVFSREQIARSGVINLNSFLKREILDSDATTLPPELNAKLGSFASGSSNLNFGGFGADATIVLVDGRRMSEIVTALPASLTVGPVPPQPDVNVIPINLIERVEVLPVSASAIYSGSPVGGVINVVLRPNVNTTELTTTYTNSTGRFDAPQSTESLLHGETLLGGRLHVRFNATFTQITPPTEAELGYIRANDLTQTLAENELYRATPNVASASQSPLFGPGTPLITSVAPGSDGTGGLGAFAGRQGVQSLGLFKAPGGGLVDSPNSIDYPYGRKEQSMSVSGAATYDVFPWLQVGVDATAGRTVNNTGYSVFAGNLVLPASSPFNPFHQDVDVALNETAPLLGEKYDEARIDYYSAVFGALLKFRNDWQASFDAQYGLSVTRYRGIEGVDNARWQNLVNEGIYNPLRDTQVYGPPQQFYDQALVFYGAKGSFVTLGDYDTFDSSLRVTNQSLAMPTGVGTITLGGDYRYARLESYIEDLRYGDGSLVGPPTVWVGRSLQRVSAFGELQAPLVPPRWLPRWILNVETDLAARYTVSSLANETNLAPTGAVKVDFPGGFSLRGTYATSNRFPSPYFSRPLGSATSGTGAVVPSQVFDPLRGNQEETVQTSDALNPGLVAEAAATQTAGVIFQRGTVHRFRLSVDFVDIVTSGQEQYLEAQQVVDLENLFPHRVIRAPTAPGDPYGVGVITSVYTGNFNLAWRHSDDCETALDYAWTRCLGGTLEAYCRWIYYVRYNLEALPDTPVVDELRRPDGSTPGLIRQRMNFGASWDNKRYGFGFDGHYFHSRILPELEWAAQGSDQVNPYCQFDAFVQADLGRWLPWTSTHYSIRGQLRIDNLFDAGPPRYAEDDSGAGVQSYGDWRGRIYSVSATVTF